MRGKGIAAASGTVRVGVGLVILGVTSYAYLTLAARRLPVADFASVSVLWSVVYIVGPGVFQPFEQQLGRALAARRARDDAHRHLPARVIRVAVIIVVALTLVTVGAARPLTHVLFGDSPGVLIALVLSYSALAAAYVYRGVLAGEGRFDLYGAQLGIEGGVRVVGIVLLTSWGTATVGAVAALIPVAQAVSVLATARGRRSLVSTPARVLGRGTQPPGDVVSSTDRALGSTLAWLVVGAVASQTLVNASTLLARLLAREDPVAVGHLQAALLIARVPLFLFAAVQAALLPSLSALVATGRLAALRRRILLVTGGITIVMTLASLVVGLAGPWAVRTLFGPAFLLSGGTLASLTAGTGLFMLGGACASAVLAVGRFRSVALRWGWGVVAMLGFTLVPMSLIDRLVLGFVAGSGVAGVLMVLLVRSWTRTPSPGTSTAATGRVDAALDGSD